MNVSINNEYATESLDHEAHAASSIRPLQFSLTSLMVRTISTGDGVGTQESPGSSAFALQSLQHLLHLNLSSNKFQDIDTSISIITRTTFPRLVELKFGSNPIPSETQARQIERISKVSMVDAQAEGLLHMFSFFETAKAYAGRFDFSLLFDFVFSLRTDFASSLVRQAQSILILLILFTQ